MFPFMITGPQKGCLKAVDIDMSSMTDTFMTVAVLAAVANGTSRIYNIANQRVKVILLKINYQNWACSCNIFQQNRNVTVLRQW